MNRASIFFLLLTFTVLVDGWVYIAMLFFGLAVASLVREVLKPIKGTSP